MICAPLTCGHWAAWTEAGEVVARACRCAHISQRRTRGPAQCSRTTARVGR